VSPRISPHEATPRLVQDDAGFGVALGAVQEVAQVGADLRVGTGR
jgi:hypothetical protein